MSSALRVGVVRAMRPVAAAARQQPRRGMANNPAEIRARQELLSADNPQPTWLKNGKTDGIIAAAGGFMAFCGLSQVLYYLSKMSKGKGKIEVS